jgi:hypothetical protein
MKLDHRACEVACLDYRYLWRWKRGDGETHPDCSCGCAYFLEVADKLGADWGVCLNPVSPRCGLLTFEHMGCLYWDGKYRG